MFGFSGPTCPCDPAAKAWVEDRLRWLVEEFPDTCFAGRPVVRPLAECFPDPYDVSESSVRRLLARVCGYMGVPAGKVALTLVSDSSQPWLVNEAGHDIPQLAGTYEQRDQIHHIRIDRRELEEPIHVIGTMAHELAHARLLGEGRIDPDAFDGELLTDLTAVALGFGVFLANSPRNWHSQLGKWPGSDLNRPEYMSPPMFGYALAHLAWSQGESLPDWSRDLHWTARGEFKQALRFLEQTGDTTFKPQELGHSRRSWAAGASTVPTVEESTADDIAVVPEIVDPSEAAFDQAVSRSGIAGNGLQLLLGALTEAPRLLGVPAESHITGPQLCVAVVRYAEESFGAEGLDALSEWGLASGPDVGRGVAALIEAGLMEASEDDSPIDVDAVGPLRGLFDPQ